MKVAIVCDWLVGIGGAERVVLELHKLFPEAPIYTSQYDPVNLDWFADADVRTGWLQKLPVSLKKFLPPLRAWHFSHLNLKDYDLVISSSGAEAKGIKTGPHTVHITYCHSPTHYYWIRYEEYMKNPGFGLLNPLARLGLKLLAGPMKRWDYKAAQRPDYFIANSTYTKRHIQRYYNRNSTIVFPPVDVERFAPHDTATTTEPAKPRSGFVVVGRQTPYKRIDLAIQACAKLYLPLTVIGNGPDHNRLKKLPGGTVHFLTDVNDTDIAQFTQQAEAFILPNADDFGIVAVEALSAGTPVIAYKGGGALDYVQPGASGLFFDELTVESLISTLQAFRSADFSNLHIMRYAQRFSAARFRTEITNTIATLTKEST